MARVMVTGASGFIGGALRARLAQQDVSLICPTRSTAPAAPGWVRIPNDAGRAFWESQCAEVDAVVHLAGIAHTYRSGAEYRKANTEFTRLLAECCRSGGVGRFIFLSTAKVFGERSTIVPFDDDSPTAPQTEYAASKCAAEIALRNVCEDSAMDYVILRPPLVYGPGARGNLRTLVQLVSHRVPLPVAGIDNRRSLLQLDNLVDAICGCITARRDLAASFTLCDATLSTPELVKEIASLLHVKPRLFKMPRGLLNLLGTAVGRRRMVDALTGSFVVRGDRIVVELGWQPPHSLRDGLARMVNNPG